MKAMPFMEVSERADAIIKDILDNHLPRIREGLEKGYPDENQVLVVYDHMVRVRVMREIALGVTPEPSVATSVATYRGIPVTPQQVAELRKVERETLKALPIRCCKAATAEGVCQEHGAFEYYFDGGKHTSMSQGIGLADLHQWVASPNNPADYGFFLETAEASTPDIKIAEDTVIDLKGFVRNFYSVPAATFGAAVKPPERTYPFAQAPLVGPMTGEI
jgi:hypothetical protein